MLSEYEMQYFIEMNIRLVETKNIFHSVSRCRMSLYKYICLEYVITTSICCFLFFSITRSIFFPSSFDLLGYEIVKLIFNLATGTGYLTDAPRQNIPLKFM